MVAAAVWSGFIRDKRCGRRRRKLHVTASRHLPSVATSPSWLVLLFGVLEELLVEVVLGSGRGTRRTGGGSGTDGDEVHFWGCKGKLP